MGISTQTITVDLSKQLTRPQVVRLGQGDKSGTTLVADIYDNGVAYNLTGKTARFSMRAPDGASSYSVAASSYNGNKATFDLDETYAASIAGKTDTAYIEVLSGSTVICSTSRITVVVYRSASQGLPVAGAYSDAISEAISAANTATAEVREAMSDISELAVPLMSADTRGGAKLGSGLAVSDGALSVSPIPDASIDSVASGDSQTGAQSLSLTGLSRLWAKMRVAFAAMSHVHSADDVTSGTLPVARGGTGVSTAAAERERLGLGPTTGALPVANGGTGANTAAGARTALGAASQADLTTLEGEVDTLGESIYPTGTYNIVVSFSSAKSGVSYHALYQLPPGNRYSSVTHSVISQVGSGTSALTTSDVSSRILSDNTIDFYTSVDAAAGKQFTLSITLA